MTQSADRGAQPNARIKDIAEALGLPVSAFDNAQAATPLNELRDLLLAYFSITDSQGRQRVMNIAQREASRCQAPPDREPSLG